MVSDDLHLVSRLRKRQSKALKGLISPTSKNVFFYDKFCADDRNKPRVELF